jgi:peptidoglycan/LPS O-acetylase OafA/YrhL
MTDLKRATYYPELDGWKGYAVLWILLGHSVFIFGLDFRQHLGLLFTSSSTDFGVDIFFIVSGFLIAGNFGLDHGGVDLIAFFIKRAARILPAYAGLLALIALFNSLVPNARVTVDNIEPAVALSCRESAEILLTGTGERLPGSRRSFPVPLRRDDAPFWVNLLLVQNYMPLGQRVKLLEHTWFVAMIVHFYIFYGIMTYLASAVFRDPERRRSALTVIMLACLFLAAVLRSRYGASYETYWQMTHFRLDTALLGSLLGLHQGLFRRLAGVLPWQRTARSGLFLLGLLLGTALYSSWPPVNKYLHPAVFSLSSSALGLMIAVTQAEGAFARRVFGNPVITWVGRYSYGIFLFHYPMMFLYRLLFPGKNGSALSSIVVFSLLAVVGGAALQSLFDAAQRYAKRLRQEPEALF